MQEQIVEIAFWGEMVGGYVWDVVGATYTLYRLPGDRYLVHVKNDGGSWLVADGGSGFGLTGEEVKMSFPHLADATGMGPPETLVLAP